MSTEPTGALSERELAEQRTKEGIAANRALREQELQGAGSEETKRSEGRRVPSIDVARSKPSGEIPEATAKAIAEKPDGHVDPSFLDIPDKETGALDVQALRHLNERNLLEGNVGTNAEELQNFLNSLRN